MDLGFFNPTLRLNSWDVTSFCMQVRNREANFIIYPLCLQNDIKPERRIKKT